MWQTVVTVAGLGSKNNFHFMQFSLAGVEDRLRRKYTLLVLKTQGWRKRMGRFCLKRRAQLGSGGTLHSKLHSYLPTQIFRLCAIPELMIFLFDLRNLWFLFPLTLILLLSSHQITPFFIPKEKLGEKKIII